MGVDELRWCSNCVAMSTRPRITFDERGWCNACRWSEEKQNIDWAAREQQLGALLDRHRSDGRRFDCIVPVSGGKDGSYVAHTLKHRYGMNPLAVTVNPPLPLELGQRNLRAFADSGFDLVAISPSPEAMRQLDRIGFEEMGFPYYGWLIAIHTAVIRVALSFGISLLFYGEDGEVEYGGSTETAHEPVYGMDYQRRIYLEGGYEKVLARCDVPEAELFFFTFPAEGAAGDERLEITHWSYFENWDPYRNYLVAKQHCGLAENTESNAGTFTNFAQNDQALYALHTYLMYLKFGFGRANQDAAIEIRRGAMDRAQAVNLVNLYDGQYPETFIEQYLEHYRMTKDEFDAALNRWANRDLFEKVEGRWLPLFKVA
jgi:N-acetyl sugar amidotransferase